MRYINDIKSPTLQTRIQCMFLGVLMLTWLAMLILLWEAWQSVNYPLQADHHAMHLYELDNEFYLSYLDKHQRFAPKNKSVLKTIHVCNLSTHSQPIPHHSIGCGKQSKVRFI